MQNSNIHKMAKWQQMGGNKLTWIFQEVDDMKKLFISAKNPHSFENELWSYAKNLA